MGTIPPPANYDWLVHLDRQLTSPLELLHVSALKPHELTQEFKDPSAAVQPFSHRVPWFDDDLASVMTLSHRLYRFFEFVETRSRTATMPPPPLPPGNIVTTSITTAPVNGTTASITVGPVGPPPPIVPPFPTSGLTAGGMPWSIQPGSVLVVDTGVNQENVRVTAVTANSFTANFYLNHTAPFPVYLTTTGDRIPGKINVNTIFDTPFANAGDPSSFSALCDPSTANSSSFAAADVANLYSQLVGIPAAPGPGILGQRTPGDTTTVPAVPPGIPSSKDSPFWGYGCGTYPAGDTQYPSQVPAPAFFGINNTFLKAYTPGSAGNTPRLLEVPASGAASMTTPPWNKFQLLNKIFNNITTRSNVFAVYVTVGFFEVIDDTVRPMKLGAEIGRSENRNIRHRMFAIVDRTSLKAPTPITSLSAAVAQGTQVATVGTLSGVVPAAAKSAANSSNAMDDPDRFFSRHRRRYSLPGGGHRDSYTQRD